MRLVFGSLWHYDSLQRPLTKRQALAALAGGLSQDSESGKSPRITAARGELSSIPSSGLLASADYLWSFLGLPNAQRHQHQPPCGHPLGRNATGAAGRRSFLFVEHSFGSLFARSHYNELEGSRGQQMPRVETRKPPARDTRLLVGRPNYFIRFCPAATCRTPKRMIFGDPLYTLAGANRKSPPPLPRTPQCIRNMTIFECGCSSSLVTKMVHASEWKPHSFRAASTQLPHLHAGFQFVAGIRRHQLILET